MSYGPQAGTTPERLVLAVAATSDANGLITIRLGPAPLGYVWQGSVTITNAPSGALFSSTVASTSWGQWAGPTNFGPVQLWGNETLVVTGVGLQPSTQYSMLFFGVSLPEHLADPLPPVAPTSVVNVETATKLVDGLAIFGVAPSITVTVPSLTRRMTIMVKHSASALNVNNVVGGTSGIIYYAPITFNPTVTTVPDVHFFAIEPTVDSTYTINFSGGTGGGSTATVWVVASTLNPYVTSSNSLEPLNVNAGLVLVAGSPAGVFKTSFGSSLAVGNGQVIAAAPGVGSSIYVQTLGIANGAGARGVFRHSGGPFAELGSPAANTSNSIAFPGGFELPGNSALTVDIFGVTVDVFATWLVGPTLT